MTTMNMTYTNSNTIPSYNSYSRPYNNQTRQQGMSKYRKLLARFSHVTSQWSQVKLARRLSKHQRPMIQLLKASREQQSFLKHQQSKEKLVNDTTQGRVGVIPDLKGIVKEPHRNNTRNNHSGSTFVRCSAITEPWHATESSNARYKRFQVLTWNRQMHEMIRTYAVKACMEVSKMIRYCFDGYEFPVPFQRTDLTLWNEILGMALANSGSWQVAPRFLIVVDEPVFRGKESWENPVLGNHASGQSTTPHYRLSSKVPGSISMMLHAAKKHISGTYRPRSRTQSKVLSTKPVVWKPSRKGAFLIAELMTTDMHAFKKVWSQRDLDQVQALTSYMHSLGVVHSDMHKSNVMCKATSDFKQYRWYINDFGSFVYQPIWYHILLKHGYPLSLVHFGWETLCRYDYFRLGVLDEYNSPVSINSI